MPKSKIPSKVTNREHFFKPSTNKERQRMMAEAISVAEDDLNREDYSFEDESQEDELNTVGIM